jgi:hypothetical protein
MAKEEKPLEYQRRIRETKGVAQRLDLSYLKRVPFLLTFRKQVTWILLGLAALVSIPLVLGLGSSKRALSTGPLSSSHAVFEGRCEVCHAQAFTRVKDAACERCHDGAPHPAKTIDMAKPNDTPECIECHVEHRGEVRLSQVNTGNCTRCHANLEAHAENINIKGVKIAGFREKSHPEFSTAAMTDARPFKLNHLKHMPDKPANINGIKLPMKCVDCHKIDPNSPTGEMIPLTFEASCKSCHKEQLRFDIYRVLGPESKESPHTRDQETIRTFIKNAYTQALDANRGLLERPLGRDLVISNPEAWKAKVIEDSYEYMFSDRCTYCHVMETRYEVKKVDPKPPESATAPKQAPLGILGRYPEGKPWLQRGEFSHRSHREVECESCHREARKSQKTEDVLIPKLQTCLPCHGERESRAGLDRCSECHQYHNRSLEKERERRPTEKIIGRLTGSERVDDAAGTSACATLIAGTTSGGLW